MAMDDETRRRLEQAMVEAHRTRQVPFLGPDWSDAVMREVRRVAIRSAHGNGVTAIDRLVWRTAGIAAAVALVLTVSLITWSQTRSPDGGGLAAEELESAPWFFD